MPCPIHLIPLICPACTGRAGGQARSEAKTAAARRNAKKGGRKPKKTRQGSPRMPDLPSARIPLPPDSRLP